MIYAEIHKTFLLQIAYKWLLTTVILPCDSPRTSLANILCPMLLILSNSLTHRETLSVLRASHPNLSTLIRKHLCRWAEEAASAAGGVEDGAGSSPKLSSPMTGTEWEECEITNMIKIKLRFFVKFYERISKGSFGQLI